MSTVANALALLEYFNESRPVLGLTELQRLCGRDKATVYRYLAVLNDCGFVEQDPRTRAYRLGHRLERLATMRRKTVSPADSIAPIIESLSREVGELVHVSRLVDGVLIPIYHNDLSSHTVRVGLEPDINLPILTTSSGNAILAFLNQAERLRLITEQYNRYGHADMPSMNTLQTQLNASRERGYALCSDTFEAGVTSVGIPLFDANGNADAACAIAFPTVRRSDELIATCVQALFAHSAALIDRLGGSVPINLHAIWSPQNSPTRLHAAVCISSMWMVNKWSMQWVDYGMSILAILANRLKMRSMSNCMNCPITQRFAVRQMIDPLSYPIFCASFLLPMD